MNPPCKARPVQAVLLAVIVIVIVINEMRRTHNFLARVDAPSLKEKKNFCSVNRRVRPRMAGGRRTRQSLFPAPPVSASLRAKKSISATTLADIFAQKGLTPLALTRDEAARAKRTPRISWSSFIKLGACKKSEWVICEMIPGSGYKRFLCASPVAQPYAPMAPGKPGILIRLPDAVWTARDRDDDRIFQVFSRTDDDLLLYCGEYATVPDVQIDLDWFDVPHKVRTLKARSLSG
jgi:hypothetical protein